MTDIAKQLLETFDCGGQTDEERALVRLAAGELSRLTASPLPEEINEAATVMLLERIPKLLTIEGAPGPLGVGLSGRAVAELARDVLKLAAAASPLPEEIAGLMARVDAELDGVTLPDRRGQMLRELQAALQQQAREIERLRHEQVTTGIAWEADEKRIRELEAENERLNKALTLAAMTICDAGGVKNAFATTRDLEARIRELRETLAGMSCPRQLNAGTIAQCTGRNQCSCEAGAVFVKTGAAER